MQFLYQHSKQVKVISIVPECQDASLLAAIQQVLFWGSFTVDQVAVQDFMHEWKLSNNQHTFSYMYADGAGQVLQCTSCAPWETMDKKFSRLNCRQE